jgi:DNA-binding transcriptional LysR family regulator
MDQLTEMEAFATVVDQGGFTNAAKKLGLSKSAVSKHVSSLEARLGARLLNRTTRRVNPTEIGQIYFDRVRQVIIDAGEADALVAAMQSAPAGSLRVSVPEDLGVSCITPLLGKFLAQYPDIAISLDFSDQPGGLIAEGFDVAIRVGQLEDSSLLTRKICATQQRLVGSPAYFQTHGKPVKIDDLRDHQLLHYSNFTAGNVWKLTSRAGEERQVRTSGALAVNSGQSLLDATIAGLGIAYLPSYLYASAMREGLLEEAMPDLPVVERGVHVVFPSKELLQSKVRVFIEFLAEQLKGVGPNDW